MTKFDNTSTMAKNNFSQPLNVIDISYVLVIFMLTFLVGSLWLVEPSVESIPLIKSIGLNLMMLALSLFAISIYVIGTFFRTFNRLKIVSIYWIPAMLFALFVWTFYGYFLKLTSSTGIITEAVSETNVLISIFGIELFNFIQSVWVYAVIESLILGILIMFFSSLAETTKGKSALAIVLFLIVGFMSVLHGAIALAIDTTGTLDFSTILLHQFVAFAIMGIVFLFTGMSGNIAFHQVKNGLAIGMSTGLWVFMFIVYLLFTLIAVRQQGGLASVPKAIEQGFKV